MLNTTDLIFTDISIEKYRTYVYPNAGVTTEVRIDEPTHLNVSKNGHRVFDSHGTSHYIPKGWIHLYWEAKGGEANFVK